LTFIVDLVYIDVRCCYVLNTCVFWTGHKINMQLKAPPRRTADNLSFLFGCILSAEYSEQSVRAAPDATTAELLFAAMCREQTALGQAKVCDVMCVCVVVVVVEEGV